jgi:hypothetical protein
MLTPDSISCLIQELFRLLRHHILLSIAITLGFVYTNNRIVTIT